jgi:hypothetical protein
MDFAEGNKSAEINQENVNKFFEGTRVEERFKRDGTVAKCEEEADGADYAKLFKDHQKRGKGIQKCC